MNVASGETLKRIREGCLNGSIGIQRDKSVFRLAIPASDDDVKEFRAAVDAFKSHLDEQIKQPDHDKDLEAQRVLIDVLEMKSLPGGQFELSVDAQKLFPQLPKIFKPLDELDVPSDEAAQRFKNAVAAVRGKNIPIDEKLTVNTVILEFGASTLPAEKTDATPAGKGLVEGR